MDSQTIVLLKNMRVIEPPRRQVRQGRRGESEKFSVGILRLFFSLRFLGELGVFAVQFFDY
jgi:hypothetical protein